MPESKKVNTRDTLLGGYVINANAILQKTDKKVMGSKSKNDNNANTSHAARVDTPIAVCSKHVTTNTDTIKMGDGNDKASIVRKLENCKCCKTNSTNISSNVNPNSQKNCTSNENEIPHRIFINGGVCEHKDVLQKPNDSQNCDAKKTEGLIEKLTHSSQTTQNICDVCEHKKGLQEPNSSQSCGVKKTEVLTEKPRVCLHSSQSATNQNEEENSNSKSSGQNPNIKFINRNDILVYIDNESENDLELAKLFTIITTTDTEWQILKKVFEAQKENSEKLNYKKKCGTNIAKDEYISADDDLDDEINSDSSAGTKSCILRKWKYENDSVGTDDYDKGIRPLTDHKNSLQLQIKKKNDKEKCIYYNNGGLVLTITPVHHENIPSTSQPSRKNPRVFQLTKKDVNNHGPGQRYSGSQTTTNTNQINKDSRASAGSQIYKEPLNKPEIYSAHRSIKQENNKYPMDLKAVTLKTITNPCKDGAPGVKMNFISFQSPLT